MSSGKWKNLFKIIVKNCLLPLTFFALSFANVATCFANPTNYGSLEEIVANDIQHIQPENGYIHIELAKKKEDYNFLYGGRYYFDRMAEQNKKGVEFAHYKNQDIVFKGEETNNYLVDYSIGLSNISKLDALKFTLLAGTVSPTDYDEYTSTNHCMISKGLASQISGADYKDLLGKTINYLNVDFTIDAVIDNSTFATEFTNISGEKFIAFRYGRVVDKTADYVYHQFLDQSRYYDNYSTFRIMFANVYRTVNDAYFTLNFHNGDWIIDDIHWYKQNANPGINSSNMKYFITAYFVVFALAIAASLVARIAIQRPKSEKETFYVCIASAFAYFAGLFLFGKTLNCTLVGGIHINVFTAFGSMFSLLYFVSALLGALVVFAFVEVKTKIISKENPLVSIIIPVYNGANYLERSIRSSLLQTYQNIEVIVVDDGSNDRGKTKKIALSFDDKRLRYFYKENGGVSSALNVGINKAKGKYICWLSHDDILPLKKIEEQLAFIEQENDPFLIPYSKNIVIDEHNRKAKLRKQFIYKVSKNGGVRPSDYFKLKNIIFSSLLVPTDYLKKHKFRTELTYSQDVFALFEMLKNGYKLKYSKYGSVFYRVHSEQGSFTRTEQIESNLRIISQNFDNYFEKTKDVGFIKSFFYVASKKSSNFDAYKEAVDHIAQNRKKYGLTYVDVLNSKVLSVSYKFLYKIKKVVLGR